MNRGKTKSSHRLVDYDRVIDWRERVLLKQFESFIPPKSSVLDIGSGSGKLASLIKRKLSLKVIAVDVVDHNISDIPFSLYDGKKLLFSDNSFDLCLIVFVLHHAPNFEQIIKEALRVSKSRVIIIEDTPSTVFSKLAWRHWDYSLNHAFHKDVMVAHGTKNVDTWKDVFNELGARVVYSKSFRVFFPVLASYPHTLFVLEKK